MSRFTRDRTTKPVSRDQIPRRERGQGNICFPCSADHVLDCRPYLADIYSCYVCDQTYMAESGRETVGVKLNILRVVTAHSGSVVICVNSSYSY